MLQSDITFLGGVLGGGLLWRYYVAVLCGGIMWRF